MAELELPGLLCSCSAFPYLLWCGSGGQGKVLDNITSASQLSNQHPGPPHRNSCEWDDWKNECIHLSPIGVGNTNLGNSPWCCYLCACPQRVQKTECMLEIHELAKERDTLIIQFQTSLYGVGQRGGYDHIVTIKLSNSSGVRHLLTSSLLKCHLAKLLALVFS